MFSQQEEQKIVSYSKLGGYNDKPFLFNGRTRNNTIKFNDCFGTKLYSLIYRRHLRGSHAF